LGDQWIGVLGGSLAAAGFIKGCVPVILKAYLVWMNLIKGGSGVRKDSAWTAAKLAEWKQLVTQMPIFLQKEDMAARVFAGGEKISEP
jgi:hypothetical protein